MIYPSWVCNPTDQSPEELARKRLRYLINRAACETVAGCSVVEFADYCGIDRGTMHTSMSAGAFSARSAMKIERAVNNTALITAAQLAYPLDDIQ